VEPTAGAEVPVLVEPPDLEAEVTAVV